MSNKNAVLSPQQWLDDPKKFLEIQRALPKHVDAERIRRISLTELRKNEKLNQVAIANPLSFFSAVIQSAQLGLEPGGGLGHCYFVPYGKEVQFQIGYQGMIQLVMNTKQVKGLKTGVVVLPEDYFEHATTQDGEIFRHVPDYNVDIRDEENISLVFAIAYLRDGGSIVEIMTKAQINRNEQKNRKGEKRTSPWNEYWDQMARKTVLRRLYKYLPKSAELSETLDNEENDKYDSSKIAREAGLGTILDVGGKAAGGGGNETPQNVGKSRTSLGAGSIISKINAGENLDTDEEDERKE